MKKTKKRNEKEEGSTVACFDMIITNFHVVKQIAQKIESTEDISRIKQIFASEKSGKDLLLATGSPSAIRKSFKNSLCL